MRAAAEFAALFAPLKPPPPCKLLLFARGLFPELLPPPLIPPAKLLWLLAEAVAELMALASGLLPPLLLGLFELELP